MNMKKVSDFESLSIKYIANDMTRDISEQVGMKTNTITEVDITPDTTKEVGNT